MSFKPYTEKIRKKKIGICSILGRIRIHHPGSGSADPDPDPHQIDTDPKHCVKIMPSKYLMDNSIIRKYFTYMLRFNIFLMIKIKIKFSPCIG